MLTYGLKDKDKEQLEYPLTFFSGFGRDPNDYIHLYVYDLEDNLLQDEMFPTSEVIFNDENTLDLDIGTHVRSMGFNEGKYKVKYLFLRRLAGKKETVFVNENGFINMGKVQTRVVNGKTRFFLGTPGNNRQEEKEIFPKELKYVVKDSGPTKDELKLDLQLIKNIPYAKNFASINKNMLYVPKQNTPNAGNIRFDLTDPNVLIFTAGVRERGFTDGMVGGTITIPGMYNYKLREEKIEEITRIVRRRKEIPLDKPDDVPFVPPDDKFVKRQESGFKDLVKTKQPETNVDRLEETPGPPQDYEDFRDDDDYGSVCFTGDTKIKLSNNRTIPIKMMKAGMKVKTEQGFAKVLKVVKDNRGFGDKLVRFGKLITTDHHPIKYRGKWYMANEIGTEFKSGPLDVWNLVLDKHHTIIANNVTSATLGKWRSMEHFLHMRDHRINMLRMNEDDFESSGGGGGGGVTTDSGEGDDPNAFSQPAGESFEDFEPELPNRNNLEPSNEFIIDAPPLRRGREELEQFISQQLNKPIDRDILPSQFEDVEVTEQIIVETFKDIPVDYTAKIVEVLDFNKVRVDVTYEQGANNSEHSGDDLSKSIFEEFFVHYKKNKISRLNTYLVKDESYNLIINIEDAPSVSEPDSDKDRDLNLKDVADRTARYVKLYEPLDDVEKGDLVYFVEEKMEPYEDTIELIPFEEEEEDVLFLRVPNLNSTTNPINFRGTKFQKYDDLIGTDTQTQDDVIDIVQSGSLLDVQLNIDYQKRTDKLGEDRTDFGFGNFVNFSGAENRLRNFKKKVQLIEGYTKDIGDLVNVSSSLDTRTTLGKKKRAVINSFDPYENFLFTVSASYASSSVGEFYDSSWPKQTTSAPHTIYHTSSSEFTTWYNTWTGYAKEYDTYNQDSLKNNLPLHVQGDTQNNVFLDFMDMIGQQFDEVWTYLRHFTDINERIPKISEGISKDIVAEVAKSLGFEVNNGNDLVILPTYLLGKANDGSALNESPSEAITEEIWKRILSNMPFFLKTKGTMRAVKGLINCYGIPSSILRVREYGGPDLNERVSFEVKRKFTYALDFKSSEHLKLPYQDDNVSGIKPETIEFRFRSPKSKDMTLLNKGDDTHSFALQLRDNGNVDNRGFLELSVSSSVGMQYVTSSLLPFYNDDMWSVMLSRKSSSGADLTEDANAQKIQYDLRTKQYDATRETIVYSYTTSSIADGSTTSGSAFNQAIHTDGTMFVGGDGNFGQPFSGSIMEFRLWSEPLSSSVFDNHVRAPKAYNGNTTSSAHDNLVFRLPLENNIDLNSSPEDLKDKSYSKSYFVSASAVNFSGNSFRSLVDLEQLKVPNVGPARRNATKIRIEDTKLTGPLSYNIRREKSSQDFAPVDSNKLGVYFSPTDVIDEDILYSLADFNMDDQIGDPRDQYKLNYASLEKVQRDYWRKYARTNNFWDYMRIINFFDGTIWKQIQGLLPARANSTVGLLIEPNILERSKQVVGRELTDLELLYFENANEFNDGVQLSSRISSSESPNPFSLSGEFQNLEAAIDLSGTSLSGSLGSLGLPSLVKLGEIDPRTEFGTTYATASITFGGLDTTFKETVQPFISSSRLSEHNEIKVPYYTSSIDVSIANGYGYHTRYNGMFQYSASFEPAEFQSAAYESTLFRTFVQGDILTKDNTIDGKDPVEITITSPTRLVTQEPGESKLKVE